MDFGLFNTWNALYEGDVVPWHPDYQSGKLLEEDAYIKNYEEIDAVEEMGWDYIWLGGGHFSKQASMDPQVLMLAAVIAERTERIKIGSSIHRPVMRQEGETLSAAALPHERYGFDNLLMEDPIQTAEQVSIVDQVSRGRFIYGAGGRTRGSASRREQFFVYLEVMKQLWTEDNFSGFEGKYYSYPAFYESYLAIPKPYQKPYPPMLLPVDSQESFVPMGEQGYRIAIGAGSSPPQPPGLVSAEGRRQSLPQGVDRRRTPRRPHHRRPHPDPDRRHQVGSRPPDQEPDGPRPSLLLRAHRHRQHRRRRRQPRSHRGGQPLRHAGGSLRQD